MEVVRLRIREVRQRRAEANFVIGTSLGVFKLVLLSSRQFEDGARQLLSALRQLRQAELA